jgi:phospholipid/cholesterol/gamma-HCH transport system substrate-binding protein
MKFRTVHMVPWGRFVIAVQIIAALIFLGYTLTKKSIRLPFSDEPYEIEVVLSDAKGLDRVDEPGAAVAGTPVGRVSEVRYEDGRAVATLTVDAEIEGKVFADATAEVRPASAIQNLIVNVDPGTPGAGPLEEGERIEAGRTSSFVAIDELTGILDADTRAYVQILLGEAARGLRGRETDLRRGLGEIAELAETATPISRSLAARRRLLTRLVGQLDVIFATLGERGVELGNAVAAGSDTLEVTANREAELAALTSELAPTLAEADRSLAEGAELARILNPALDQIVPASDDLAAAMRELRGMLPRAGGLVDRFDRLTRTGVEPTELLLRGTRGLTEQVRSMIPTVEDLDTLTETMAEFRDGLPQLADTLSGAFSVNDRGGTYGQVDVLEIEDLRPENFGFGPAAARSRDGEPSRLDRALSTMLERTCRESPAACLLRFTIPGLPEEPLTLGGGEGGGS